jgi:hypothetical protein
MNDSAEMPRYKSHKTVHALKIGSVFPLGAGGEPCRVLLSFTDPGYVDITVEQEVVARYMPKPGDYFVVYDDGYKSISPAKAFEEGYTRIATGVEAAN